MSKLKPNNNSSVATWSHRKTQLRTLLGNCDDDEEEGIALDRIMHGQLAIGKTQRTIDIDGVRFCDKDLTSFGPLADAQFGTVELVSCRLDGRVYVRKRVSKKFALKTREQCSPQSERHILLLALKSQSCATSAWTPQMLCAYQCPNFLNIVMEYAAGGSLWDVLESSGEGRLAATDLAWWAPQCVAAIEWLHSHAGYTHRDVKPHNFVVRPGPAARLLLIDFGSAAPLLPPRHDGVQLVPRSNCLVPCGTCDYISPEILMAHEEALVALEMSDDECEEVADDSDAELHGRWKGKAKEKILQEDVGYGRETDWWSFGAMLYELAFGVAPFFANDIRQTYARIMSHESNLKFNSKVPVPQALVDFIKGLLTHHERRLGRYSAEELKNHAYFKGVDWSNLHSRPSPPNLLLPEFTYTTPLIPPEPDEENSETSADGSKPFAFSALFQSSVGSASMMSFQQDPMATPANGRRNMSRSGSGGSAQKSLASFIGFSWGPPKDAFDDATRTVPAAPVSTEPGLCVPPLPADSHQQSQHPLMTPMRPSRGTAPPPSTVRVTSVRRSAQARPVSDREAMKMLVNCVGQSARKKVLESGKKPKILLPHFGFALPPPPAGMTSGGDNSGRSQSRSRAPSYSRSSSVLNTVRKELRFDDTTQQIMPNLSYTNTFTTTTFSNSGMSMPIPYIPPPYSASDSGTASSETEGPPSPSPSPRPGSAMSMLSLSRRSATPTATMSSAYLMGGAGSVPPRSSSEPPEGRARKRAGSLGSLRGRRDEDDEDEDVPVRNGNGMAVQQTPRRARFADSPESSLERPTEKERIPGTPYPQALKKAAAREERQPPNTRQPRFVEPAVPVSTPKPVRSRVPSTPHPKGQQEQIEEVVDEDDDDLTPRPRRTHFTDSLLVDGEENKKKERVPSTPHPLAKAKVRRTTRPPLQAMRTHSSTPARRKKIEAELSSDEDELTRRQGRSRSSSQSEGEQNPVVKERYLWEDLLMSDGDAEVDREMERALQSRGGTPPSPVTPIHEYELYDHEYGESLDTMEQRYKKLLAEIADVRTRIDGLVASV